MPLTAKETFEHIGRMLDYGFENHVSVGQTDFQFGLRGLIKVMKAYRLNGNTGTLEERTEAMRTAGRKLCRILTGHNPDDGPMQLHQLQHFIDDIDEGDSGAYL